MNISDWLAAACADADKRGLGELKPMLESLARSTTALRLADATVEAQTNDELPAVKPSKDDEA